MFSIVKFKKPIRFLVCILTVISMFICNFSIELYYDKGTHLSFNNKVYAAEFDPAINICPIVAGTYHTLALMDDGTVKAWGDNEYGKSGLGYIVNKSTPTVINGLTGVKQIAAGDSHTLALMNDGTVKAWGDNSIGQLGSGVTPMTPYSITPTVISGLTGVKQITAGYNHTLALMNDGTVKAWGDNSSGQLGLGNTTYKNTPTAINGLTDVKQIAAGDSHTLALMNDGTVKAWGNNSSGQLGLGNTTNRSTPTAISGLTGVKQITAGYNHTLALMNDGTVKAWGGNNFGQLGLGEKTNRNIPTVINGLTGVKQIAAGGFHTLAMMNAGIVKSWGNNSSGQLGLGDINNRTIPVGILGLSFNFEPNLSIQTPSSGYKFTASQNSINPEIVTSDPNNDVITCKYYFNSETIPRETKVLSNTSTQQTVSFSPIDLNTMNDGNYTIRFEVSDGQEIVQEEVNFIVDRETPSVSSITYSSDTTSISVEGTVLNDNLYKYTIGTTSTDWITDASYIWKTLIPNMAYTVKFEAKDNEGNIVTDQKTIYTKAQSPKMSIENIDKTSLDMYIEDSNSPTTEYQIISGTSYITSTFTLTSTPTWITIPSKILKVTGLTPNKNYSFKMKARNEEGIETVYSAPVEISTLTNPPPCPSGLVPDLAKISNTTIAINWDSVTTAAGYDIEADGIIKSTIRTSFEHTGLTPNSQHTYRVRAKSSYGVGEWSPIVNVLTTFNAPGNISNINAYAEDSLVLLIWEDVRDAEYYEIEFDGNVLNNGIDDYCTKVGLAPNSQHSYKVRAVNAAGEGQWSSIASITTYPIGTPKNIKTVEEEYAVTLSWEPVKDASSYEIQVNEHTIATVTDTIYKHTNLNPETQYIYKIKAIGPQGEGGFSNNISIYTLPVKPKVPDNITASVTNNVVTLIWDPVDTAIGYDVELDGVLIDNGSSTTYIHEELLKSTDHMYKVRAKNDAIEGEWSSLLALRTMQGKPTFPDKINVSTTPTITTLTWDAQDDAISYDIEVDGKIVDNISKTSYRHRRIAPLTEHVYRIRTRNITGISPWSGYIINNSIKALCKKDKEVDLGLTASDIIDFSKYTLIVTYNKDVLEVSDLCTFSPKIELTKGTIEGTGITITEYSPGKIVFVVDKSIPPEESWTGVINSIKFKTKVSGGTNITYSVFSKPEE